MMNLISLKLIALRMKALRMQEEQVKLIEVVPKLTIMIGVITATKAAIATRISAISTMTSRTAVAMAIDHTMDPQRRATDQEMSKTVTPTIERNT